MKINLTAVAIVSVFVIVVGVIFYLIIVDDMKCDELVTLTDGQKIECKSAHSSDNGMTYLTTCEDEKISVPTLRIERITKIKTSE
jgi:hypothetical protein